MKGGAGSPQDLIRYKKKTETEPEGLEFQGTDLRLMSL
jgi:hypothetical protein